MVTPEQRRVIDAVVAINETGKLPSPAAYATVTVLSDGAGISYGKHQSTDRSNSLDLVVKRYIALGGAEAVALSAYVPRLEANETAAVDPKKLPQWVLELMGVLAKAGGDPVMQRAQDEVFDENYWRPAETRCHDMGLVTALAHLALYDVAIHSGPGRIDTLRKVFAARPPATGGEETQWTMAFLKARADWLRGHSNPLVQKTVDRVVALQKLGEEGRWDLATPLKYRFGLTIQ